MIGILWRLIIKSISFQFIFLIINCAPAFADYIYSECQIDPVVTGYHKITGEPLYSCYLKDWQYDYNSTTCTVSLITYVSAFMGPGGTSPEGCLAWVPVSAGFEKYICWGSKPNGVDNDSDLHYGVSQWCPQGGDCNDNDSSVYPGLPEICDGIDNNCNGQIDEGFDAGATCSVGEGACKKDGVKVCSADHLGTVCNAVPDEWCIPTKPLGDKGGDPCQDSPQKATGQ